MKINYNGKQVNLSETLTRRCQITSKYIWRYHSTDLCEYKQCGQIIRFSLNYNRRKSATTKKRFNQFLQYYNLPYKVIQKDFSWYITLNGKVLWELQKKSSFETHSYDYTTIFPIGLTNIDEDF